ncbi:MAG: HDOD domain-containing protein [Desulfobacterales bacterium]|nr:HDOD domain-containing protein [Desulfobacterales bacterium]
MAELQRHHVASGSYFVGKKSPMLLQAFLGTCVGVAIFDPAANVGGLIHILLPSPNFPDNTYQQKKYATTGLPLFIDALLEAGAAKNRLQAALAGGALVGPIDERDLALDIGGRTVEAVKSILQKNNITVISSETGGFLTGSFSLNMQSWEFNNEPVGQNRLSEKLESGLPPPSNLDAFIETLEPIPQVALKILRIINEDNYDIQSIAEEARKDQVISAKTLKLCNSAAFASRHEIASLDEAIVLLGRDMLVKLIISASVKHLLDQSSQGYSLCKGGLYHHAVGTAQVSETLAKYTGRVPTPIAYTTGLLHDIGKVVLDQYVAIDYPLFYRKIREEKDVLLAEKKVLNTNHVIAGCKLADKWMLPDTIRKTIKHHHHPGGTTPDDDIVHIVYLADLIMANFHSGLELEAINTRYLASSLEWLGLSTSNFSEVIEIIPSRVFDTSADLAG